MPGNPYFFAPAAEPFHEVITARQRSFQFEVGKIMQNILMPTAGCISPENYSTCFFLLYGDTYPIYNGSIGFTYEQAGHGRWARHTGKR